MAPETITHHVRATRSSRERSPGPRPPATDAVRFVESLLHMSRPRIERQAAVLKARLASPGDDLAWWQATMALDRALRRQGTWYQAAMAAQLASEAVLAAASRTGLVVPGPDVNAVARSAGDVARTLAAGMMNTVEADYLTQGWQDLLIAPPAPPSPSGAAGGRGHQKPRAAAHQPRRRRR